MTPLEFRMIESLRLRVEALERATAKDARPRRGGRPRTFDEAHRHFIAHVLVPDLLKLHDGNMRQVVLALVEKYDAKVSTVYQLLRELAPTAPAVYENQFSEIQDFPRLRDDVSCRTTGNDEEGES